MREVSEREVIEMAGESDCPVRKNLKSWKPLFVLRNVLKAMFSA
jgi:hypothetical protein